jgi:hypothetical protein
MWVGPSERSVWRHMVFPRPMPEEDFLWVAQCLEQLKQISVPECGKEKVFLTR